MLHSHFLFSTLCPKYLNVEFICSLFSRIQTECRDLNLCVQSKKGKKGPEKHRVWILFTQWCLSKTWGQRTPMRYFDKLINWWNQNMETLKKLLNSYFLIWSTGEAYIHERSICFLITLIMYLCPLSLPVGNINMIKTSLLTTWML